jgi:hypothetical protein
MNGKKKRKKDRRPKGSHGKTDSTNTSNEKITPPPHPLPSSRTTMSDKAIFRPACNSSTTKTRMCARWLMAGLAGILWLAGVTAAVGGLVAAISLGPPVQRGVRWSHGSALECSHAHDVDACRSVCGCVYCRSDIGREVCMSKMQANAEGDACRVVVADGGDACAAEPWKITLAWATFALGVVFLFVAGLVSCMIVAVAAASSADGDGRTRCDDCLVFPATTTSVSVVYEERTERHECD